MIKRIPKDIRQCKYCSNCCTVVMKNWNNKHTSKYCFIGIDSISFIPYFPYLAKDCPYFEVAEKYTHTNLSDACKEINDCRRIIRKYKNK